MGWYTLFKMRHNLDSSTIGSLLSDLKQKLNCEVNNTVNHSFKRDQYQLQMLAQNTTIGITIKEEKECPTSLINFYRKKIEDSFNSDHNYEKHVKDIRKRIHDFRYYNFEYETDIHLNPEIWNITHDTISGDPHFKINEWSYLSRILTGKRESNEWREFIEERQTFYLSIKPLLAGDYIYYHVDQGIMEDVSQLIFFDDIPQYAAENGEKIFNLSEYIQGNNICFDHSIIRDDFMDILKN